MQNIHKTMPFNIPIKFSSSNWHDSSHFFQNIRGCRYVFGIYQAAKPAIETEVEIEKSDYHYQPNSMHQMQVGLRIRKPSESEKELVIARGYEDANEHPN